MLTFLKNNCIFLKIQTYLYIYSVMFIFINHNYFYYYEFSMTNNLINQNTNNYLVTCTIDLSRDSER
ncbi:hypothetical protein FD25_GL001578 [Levilactobacillus acidifarinae DSM 19394]|uniref:Uncharacterized protein n=1 Tax=Levilactobacillus acidifarinae DSM 19394 = JCM 15949 TaxID=1423715 RepID=A0A0R1LH26_9LACO|nr:hypothetical protein FD25_GL001578 [Levilactobacillus acidifarinae DSM 19394]